jgi:hypothetical protein
MIVILLYKKLMYSNFKNTQLFGFSGIFRNNLHFYHLLTFSIIPPTLIAGKFSCLYL